MFSIILRGLATLFRSRRALALENPAIRQQLAVLQRNAKRPRLRRWDRGFWVLVSRIWSDWQNALVFVRPETVIRWHRQGFRLYWGRSRPHSPDAAGQQMIEASPWETAPRFTIRDQDGIYGEVFVRRVNPMGIEQVLISARPPWQNPYVERVIGSIRRDCLGWRFRIVRAMTIGMPSWAGLREELSATPASDEAQEAHEASRSHT
jgi:hypothetical protein